MIKRLLIAIRRKPKTVRDNIAFGIAGGFTAIVMTLWLYNMPAKVAAIADGQGNDDSSPAFSKMFDDIGKQIANIKDFLPQENEVNEGPFDSIGVETTSFDGDREEGRSELMILSSSTPASSVVIRSEFGEVSSSTGSQVLEAAENLSGSTTPSSRAIRIITVSSSTTSDTAASTTTENQ